MGSFPPKKLTFEELIDWHTNHAHSCLLERGGVGLKTAIWEAMTGAISWEREQINLVQKKRKTRKRKE